MRCLMGCLLAISVSDCDASGMGRGGRGKSEGKVRKNGGLGYLTYRPP